MGRLTKRTDPPETRLQAARETIERLPAADITIFTDGSATAGLENGGGGAIFMRNGGEESRLRILALW